MAKYEMQLPDKIIKDIEQVDRDCEKIFGKMTQAGAKVVMDNIKRSAPAGIKKSKMMRNLIMTKIYKTPSDGGINTKVAFYGYFYNEKGRKTPAPLVGNVFEYGRSGRPFRKQPFMRASFNESQIKRAMLKEQEKLTRGLLK